MIFSVQCLGNFEWHDGVCFVVQVKYVNPKFRVKIFEFSDLMEGERESQAVSVQF